MKKILIITMSLVLAVAMLTACGKKAGASEPAKAELSVVTTIFPEYDWVKNILGDKAESSDITLLLDNGADLHSYQPSADDIMKIANSDVFVYVGGESDEWVDDVIGQSAGKGTKVINLMEMIGDAAKEEEVVEGMQEEEHDQEEEEGPEYDEHVWLSLKNAKVIVNGLAEALSAADEENADEYRANAADYIEKLEALDTEYDKTVSAAKVKTLLFGDRFPFRYMTDDYGLKYYAAFVGCSAETEASFETVKFLADKVDELALKNIMIIDGSDGKIADTIKETTKTKDQKVLSLDSMQTTAVKDIENGETYLGAMEKNLEILKEALN